MKWKLAGSPGMSQTDQVGCRTLVVFKGAGFDFFVSANLAAPVTLSAQNRPSTTQHC
jgi:hypothetical protein